MYIDLLNNLAITSALLFFAGTFFRNRVMGLSASAATKVIVGLGAGLLGILLMLSSISVTDSVILDLRNLAIVISAVFGGPLGAMLAGVIIGAARILLYGVSDASLMGGILAISYGILFSLYFKIKLSDRWRFILMNLTYLILGSFPFYILIEDPALSARALSSFWLIGVVAGFFAYYIIEYITKSNENHRSILYFKLMADNATDLVSTHHLDGRFKYLSPSSVKLLGYEPDELVGKNPYDYYHPDDANETQRSHQSVVNALTETESRYRFKRKNGEYIWLETVSRLMIRESGNSREIICASRDITIRKRIETELMKANRKLQRLSLLDGLTEIPNRRALDQRITAEWERAAGESRVLSLILFDVDHFKRFNDSYGHQVGDECLKLIAGTAQAALNPDFGFIGRYGGEEFAVILADTDEEKAIQIAEAIRVSILALEIPHKHSSVSMYVTISAGVSKVIPTREEDPSKLIAKADDALYLAKEKGRNRVEAVE